MTQKSNYSSYTDSQLVQNIVCTANLVSLGIERVGKVTDPAIKAGLDAFISSEASRESELRAELNLRNEKMAAAKLPPLTLPTIAQEQVSHNQDRIEHQVKALESVAHPTASSQKADPFPELVKTAIAQKAIADTPELEGFDFQDLLDDEPLDDEAYRSLRERLPKAATVHIDGIARAGNEYTLTEKCLIGGAVVATAALCIGAGYALARLTEK